MQELFEESTATIPVSAAKHFCEKYCVSALNDKGAIETSGT